MISWPAIIHSKIYVFICHQIYHLHGGLVKKPEFVTYKLQLILYVQTHGGVVSHSL